MTLSELSDQLDELRSRGVDPDLNVYALSDHEYFDIRIVSVEELITKVHGTETGKTPCIVLSS